MILDEGFKVMFGSLRGSIKAVLLLIIIFVGVYYLFKYKLIKS